MSFAANWKAEILNAPPLIAPARQVVWPQRVAGEEEAMARGALPLLVRPQVGAVFLATCALGFRDPTLPTGVWACPNPDQLCAVAGGYAYLADVSAPESVTHLAQRPVTAVAAAPEAGLLLFAGFHHVMAWGVQGLSWQSRRLSWDGIRLGTIEGSTAHGFGWDLMADREIAFSLDLATGEAAGGAYNP